MGKMIFELPPDLPAQAREELERASVAGGQDRMPYPTQVTLDEATLVLARQVDESGCLVAPWQVNGIGRLMVTSATLMERLAPYQFTLELARGKVNQLRSQTFEWSAGGLLMSDVLAENIRRASLTFSRAVTGLPNRQAGAEALRALTQSLEAAQELVAAYIQQVFQVRHQRQPRLDSILACRLAPGVLSSDHQAQLEQAFNAVSIPFLWSEIEPREQSFHWEAYDEVLARFQKHGLEVIGGPLIDFSGRGLPHWLWDRSHNLQGLCALLTDFVERAVERYESRIRSWQVTAASNWAGVLALGDEDLMWLTLRLVEAVKRVDPNLEVSIGLAQPWGDYLAQQDRNQSPFAFADTLVRTGLKLGALDLEMIMGAAPRGSYCRDLLDVSRQLDLYALLGVPLQVTLGYPSLSTPDGNADPDQKLSAGYWRTGFAPEVQADWAAAFAGLCLAKPYVRALHWTHFTDALPHQFPHCGLVDVEGNFKPSFHKLASLRAEHLR